MRNKKILELEKILGAVQSNKKAFGRVGAEVAERNIKEKIRKLKK